MLKFEGLYLAFLPLFLRCDTLIGTFNQASEDRRVLDITDGRIRVVVVISMDFEGSIERVAASNGDRAISAHRLVWERSGRTVNAMEAVLWPKVLVDAWDALSAAAASSESWNAYGEGLWRE